MSALQRVLFTAGLAVLAFLAWQQTAGAIEVSVTAPPAWNVVEGTQISLSVTVNVPEYPEGTASAWVTLDGDIIAEAQVSVQNGVGTAEFLGNFTSEGYLQCASQGFALPTISVNIHGDGYGPLLATSHESIYCSAQISTTFIQDLVQIPVCGPNNDQISGWDNQPNGTIVDVGFWQEGKRTVSLYPNLNSFAPGTKTSRHAKQSFLPRSIFLRSLRCVDRATISSHQLNRSPKASIRTPRYLIGQVPVVRSLIPPLTDMYLLKGMIRPFR